jgi:hypothetical protein
VPRRAVAGLLAAALAAGALAACGGDDEKTLAGTETSAPPATQTAPTETAPAPTTPTDPPATETTPAPPPPPGTSTSPEDEPGGGGDEEPARTELEFRGTESGVKPLQAGVAPYISVRVTLTSEDGSAHTLTIAGRTATVGGTRTSAFFTLPGLRPGKAYRGTADGKPVRILGTAEPGP